MGINKGQRYATWAFLRFDTEIWDPHLDPQYCINPVEMLEYDELRTKYKIESLEVRRKGSLLRIMYLKKKKLLTFYLQLVNFRFTSVFFAAPTWCDTILK